MSSLTYKYQPEDSNRLLNQLLECVQECQKRFGGKTELATEFDQCVSSLCSTLESVFLHGLRSKPVEYNSTLKQVSDIVDIVTNSLHLNSDNPSFWPFIKRHLTRHEQDRYNVLKHIWTDTGKGKAWIRSTLNERSLERYFHNLLGNKSVVKTYYEEWAFLCDDEKNSLLPNMAAGLASILFAISIDKPELNSSLQTKVGKQRPEPIIEAPIVEPSKETKELKKKRKVAKQLISFDDDNDSILSSSIPSSAGSVILENSTIKELSIKAPSVSSEILVKEMEEETNSSDTQSSISSEDIQNNPENLKRVNSVENPKSAPVRKLSIENSGSRDRFSKLEGTLTPLEPCIGELTPISVECGDISDAVGILERPSDVSAILTAVEEKNKAAAEQLQEKISLLSKENENLKEQVKKYMEAVQMLKHDESTSEGVSANGLPDDNIPDYKKEAKLYEQKLVQVAEMHAELMDFNVVLQQTICQKDVTLERLKNQLEELKGPVSEDELRDENYCCVNVWIPSAFLTGSGSEAHHVYQIFLRAGCDEWNIYRRYAQFHALHSDLKKLDPVVSTFDFPPKKSLRNKDSGLVEDRRKRLQMYLRRIISHWPELSQCNSRFLLEQHLAFFKDQRDSKKDKPGLFTSRRSGGGTSSENHYSGL